MCINFSMYTCVDIGIYFTLYSKSNVDTGKIITCHDWSPDLRWWSTLEALFGITWNCESYFSPIVHPETPGYLEVLIEDNLHTFTLLYPEQGVIPKMHFLVHIPKFLARFVMSSSKLVNVTYIHTYIYIYIYL